MADSIDTRRLGVIMQTLLSELKAIGEPTRAQELIERAAPKLKLTNYEAAKLEKTGYIRWESMVHWCSVDCVKAGFIRKSGGRWALTDQGEKALKLPPDEFIRVTRARHSEYRQGKLRPVEETGGNGAGRDGVGQTEEIVRQTTYEQALSQARTEIEKQIFSLGPYDFQKLVAELLTAMGYHVPYVAAPGPDGGIDIIAYKDPLGSTTPRIRAQVKHRPSSKVTVAEVRALEGVLRKEGDMGLIVSSSGFTGDAEREIQVSSKHIETMDLDRLITLWQSHYEKIREAGKLLLPLVKVYFLAPAEE